MTVSPTQPGSIMRTPSVDERRVPHLTSAIVGNGSPVGFIYVNVTADDRYVFASAERAQAVIVIDLEHEHYQRLMVEVEDPPVAVRAIEAGMASVPGSTRAPASS